MKDKILSSVCFLVLLIFCLAFVNKLVAGEDPFEKPCKEMCAKIYRTGTDDYHACLYCCMRECDK